MADGNYLNRLKKELMDWVSEYRLQLIQDIERGGVYNTRKLTEQEQLERWASMSGQDLQMLILNLQNRYKGLPDADERVNRDLANFMSRMIALNSTREYMSPEAYNQQLTALSQSIGGV